MGGSSLPVITIDGEKIVLVNHQMLLKVFQAEELSQSLGFSIFFEERRKDFF